MGDFTAEQWAEIKRAARDVVEGQGLDPADFHIVIVNGEPWVGPRENASAVCHYCAVDCVDIGEWYMVHDHVWEASYPWTAEGEPIRFLCIGCLEERLNRRLTVSDFTDAQVNNPSATNSDRLTDRARELTMSPVIERAGEIWRPVDERIVDYRGDQPPHDSRLSGGAWTCTRCHPPADGLEVEHRTCAEVR